MNSSYFSYSLYLSCNVITSTGSFNDNARVTRSANRLPNKSFSNRVHTIIPFLRKDSVRIMGSCQMIEAHKTLKGLDNGTVINSFYVMSIQWNISQTHMHKQELHTDLNTERGEGEWEPPEQLGVRCLAQGQEEANWHLTTTVPHFVVGPHGDLCTFSLPSVASIA